MAELLLFDERQSVGQVGTESRNKCTPLVPTSLVVDPRFILNKLSGNYISYHLHLHSKDAGLVNAYTASGVIEDNSAGSGAGMGVALLHSYVQSYMGKEKVGHCLCLRRRTSCLTTGTPGLIIINFFYMQPLVTMFMTGIITTSSRR
jgi:hypothetical protein